MSAIDDVLKSNDRVSLYYEPNRVSPKPTKHLAILTCMDTRLGLHALGLEPQDAHMIRNAGGIVTEDALRSLLISHYLLGTHEFVIINHTDCGMLSFSDDELRSRLERSTGRSAVVPACFHSFRDIEENVRRQIERLRSHAWAPSQVAVRGFVYEVESGRLREVAADQARRAG